MVLKCLLVLAVVLAQLDGWKFKEGRCRPIKKLDTLDATFFNNKFYQILRTKGFPLVSGQCVTSTSTFIPDNTLSVKLEQVFNGNKLSANGTITLDLISGKLGSYAVASPIGAIEGNYIKTDLKHTSWRTCVKTNKIIEEMF